MQAQQARFATLAKNPNLSAQAAWAAQSLRRSYDGGGGAQEAIQYEAKESNRAEQGAVGMARWRGKLSKSLQAAGATSLRAIAAGLNERKIRTARGIGGRSAVQVMRVMERANIPAVGAVSDNPDRWVDTAE